MAQCQLPALTNFADEDFTDDDRQSLPLNKPSPFSPKQLDIVDPFLGFFNS
jgi:hypothetical protein